MQDKGLVTLVISFVALVFSLGTLWSDVIRNRNLLIHDLQVDGQIFHRTLLNLDQSSCAEPSPLAIVNEKNQCSASGFFETSANSHTQEIRLQRAEYLEKRIIALLDRLNMGQFGYITPIDYRTLAKAELKDLNFEKAKYFIDNEVKALSVYSGHPGYVYRVIRADLMRGWYYSILNKKKDGDTTGKAYFDRALSKAESRIKILPIKTYMVIFILQSAGCANWVEANYFYPQSLNNKRVHDFDQSHDILINEPSSMQLLQYLRGNQIILDSGQQSAILAVCNQMFDRI